VRSSALELLIRLLNLRANYRISVIFLYLVVYEEKRSGTQSHDRQLTTPVTQDTSHLSSYTKVYLVIYDSG